MCNCCTIATYNVSFICIVRPCTLDAVCAMYECEGECVHTYVSAPPTFSDVGGVVSACWFGSGDVGCDEVCSFNCFSSSPTRSLSREQNLSLTYSRKGERGGDSEGRGKRKCNCYYSFILW